MRLIVQALLIIIVACAFVIVCKEFPLVLSLSEPALRSLEGETSGSIVQSSRSSASTGSARTASEKGEPMFTLMKLPYAYDALEPFMDAKTVEIHYTKHHQGYVNNLNAALEKAPADIQKMSLEELLVSLDRIPENIRIAVRNNGGGDFNHNLFWTIMAPKAGGKPSGKLAEAIDRDFGSFEKFKAAFTEMSKAFFASGWVWLVIDKNGKLSIMSTPGHDVPMRQGFQPLMVIDVWEHAYYLKYQNRRPEFIENWWNLVNWPQVEKNYLVQAGTTK